MASLPSLAAAPERAERHGALGAAQRDDAPFHETQALAGNSLENDHPALAHVRGSEAPSMQTNLRTTTLLITALGFLAAAPTAMLASADGTAATGYVYDSDKTTPLTATYGVATHDPTDGAAQIAGRGASGMYQWHRQLVPAYNGDQADGDEAGYGSCGSSCGKRGILGTATATEGIFNCADANRWTPTGDCDTKDEAERRWSLWGASESPFTQAEQAAARDQRNAEMLTFPMSIAVISVVYNVNGCANGELKLTGALISRMYRGNEADGIRQWNHADLVALNPCLAGEATTIVPVIRCDGSGTTFAFSDFLVRSSGNNVWGPAELIAEPAQNEICGNQNPGVSQQVGANYGAFGYVEKQQADVDGRKQAQIRNRDGGYLLASELGGTAAATATAPSLPASHGDWSSVSIAYAPGANSYPISTFGYLMAIANPWDANGPHGAYRSLWTASQYNTLKEFLSWANTHTNIVQDVDVVGYAPVGAEVAAINAAGIERMNYGPRHAYDLSNGGDDVVALCGYPVVGQTVSAQADGKFRLPTLASGKFADSSAGALAGAVETEGKYVKVTGAIQAVGPLVTIDGVPAGRVACGATIDSLAAGGVAYAQVVDGSLLVHHIE